MSSFFSKKREPVIAPDVATAFDDSKKRSKVEHAEGPSSASSDHGLEPVGDSEVAQYVDASVIIDEATNKRLFKMINRRILPFLFVGYLMQALDKGATTTASIMGLQADTGMVGQDYALTTTFLWIGIIIGEFPANRVVQTYPAGKVLAAGLFIWGVLLLIMGFMRNYKAIFALRILLGLTESVVGPCLLAILVMWYKRREQPFALACYQSALGVNSIIAGLLGYGFYHVTGQTLKGWQYMFIMIAGVSMLLGVLTYFVLPDSPATANCYSEADKILFVERVRENDQGIKNKTWKHEQFKEAITDPMVWLYFLMALFNTLVVGGINTFSGILIKTNFGFDTLESQLLSMPLGAMSILLFLGGALVVKWTNQTLFTMIGMAVINAAGSIVLITVPNTNSTKVGLLIAFYVMQFFQGANPLYFGIMARNTAGSSKKTFTYALQFIGWAGGNAIAPQIFQAVWAPRYLNSLYIHLGIYGCFIATCLTARVILLRRNKQRDADQALAETGAKVTHNNAFADLTDIQNPEFRYDV